MNFTLSGLTTHHGNVSGSAITATFIKITRLVTAPVVLFLWFIPGVQIFAQSQTVVNHSPYIVDKMNRKITFLADSVQAGKSKKICLKFADPDGNSVSLVKASTANRIGSVTLAGNCFTYTSGSSFTGIDPFLLVAADNGSPVKYDTLQVYMKVFGNNTAPVILDNLGHSVHRLSESLDMDSSRQVILNGLDKESDQVSIFNIRPMGNHCQAVLMPENKLGFTLTPETHFKGCDSIRIIVADNGNPVMYDTVIYQVNVTRRNKAPLILNPLGFPADYIYKTVRGDSVQTCLFVDDPDEDPTAITSWKSLNGKGSVVVTGKNCFYYIPLKGASGDDTTVIVVSDTGKPVLTDSVNVVFHIIPDNAPPVITDENNQPSDTLKYNTREGDPLEICLKVSDTNNDKDSIAFARRLNNKGSAVVKILGGNCISYEQAKNFVGTDELVVKVADNGDPSMSDSVVVFVNVAPRLVVSEGVSPDGNGVNDQWIIRGIEKYPENSVSVFTQWGDVVYKASGYDNTNVVWRGEYKEGVSSSSGKVPNGTYFYVIVVSGAKPVNGFVVVKR